MVSAMLPSVTLHKRLALTELLPVDHHVRLFYGLAVRAGKHSVPFKGWTDQDFGGTRKLHRWSSSDARAG